MYKIVKKETLNSVVELMEIHAPFVARKCEPGQFIILRVDEDGERVPLTIADYDREKETVTIIYQVLGYSTTLLSQKKEGEYVADFVGPLGVPAALEKKENKVIGVAGGVDKTVVSDNSVIYTVKKADGTVIFGYEGNEAAPTTGTVKTNAAIQVDTNTVRSQTD